MRNLIVIVLVLSGITTIILTLTNKINEGIGIITSSLIGMAIVIIAMTKKKE